MSTLAINTALDNTSHRTGEAGSLERTDTSVKAIAVGPVLSPTAQGDSVVTFWRVTVFDVDEVRSQSQP